MRLKITGYGLTVKTRNHPTGLTPAIPLKLKSRKKRFIFPIENAQKRVEGFNFDRRKQLVEMDDIINVHREVIYKLRRRLLEISEQIVKGSEMFNKAMIKK